VGRDGSGRGCSACHGEARQEKWWGHRQPSEEGWRHSRARGRGGRDSPVQHGTETGHRGDSRGAGGGEESSGTREAGVNHLHGRVEDPQWGDGYAVLWRNRSKWVGARTHMGYNQETFDAECAALARALKLAARRRTTPEAVTIFTDAQAAIGRLVADEPGPGQKSTVMARKWIAVLRAVRPEMRMEIRWCPAHEGGEGNEKADEWAKQAAEEPDTRGVEWLRYGDRYGLGGCPFPDPWPTRRGDSGEEMGRSKELGQGANRCKKVRVAEEPAAESNGGASAKAPGGTLPPNQKGALPYGPIPEVGGERGKSVVRVGVNTGHRRENICSSTARNGSRSRRPCERRYERGQEEGRTGSRSGTCSRTSGAPARFWIFWAPRRWGAGWARRWCHRYQARTWKRSAEAWKRSRNRKARRAKDGGEEVEEVAFIVSFGHSFSFLSLSLVQHGPYSFLLSFSLSFIKFLGERPGGGRGRCHGPSADCARSRWTANGKGLYIISP